MNFTSFIVVATIVAAVFGIAFLVVPAQLAAFYGIASTPGTDLVGRIGGSAILGFAVVFWGIRNQSGAQAFKAAMLAGLIANGLDCLILLQATATGLLNGYGWPQAAINGLLALGFGYFSFGKR